MAYLLKKQQNDLTSNTTEQATADGIGVLHVGIINVFPYVARVCLSAPRVHTPGGVSVQPDRVRGSCNHTLYGLWCIHPTPKCAKIHPSLSWDVGCIAQQDLWCVPFYRTPPILLQWCRPL